MQKKEFEKLEYPKWADYLPAKLKALGITTIPELENILTLPTTGLGEHATIVYLKEMGWSWLADKVRELELAKSYKRQI